VSVNEKELGLERALRSTHPKTIFRSLMVPNAGIDRRGGLHRVDADVVRIRVRPRVNDREQHVDDLWVRSSIYYFCTGISLYCIVLSIKSRCPPF